VTVVEEATEDRRRQDVVAKDGHRESVRAVAAAPNVAIFRKVMLETIGERRPLGSSSVWLLVPCVMALLDHFPGHTFSTAPPRPR
jgi:hypothetical protein